jgi:glutamate synthase domain-containing protein 2
MHLSKLWRRTRFADLIDRYLIFALILIAAIVCAFAALAQHWTGWLLVLLAPLAALGLWDLFQQQHTLMRNYPVIAHFRWLFEDLRPYLRSYIVESDLEGTPFNKDERLVIYARAKGQEDAHPFGTELDLYAGDAEWLVHSMAPKPKAKTPFRVMVGGPQCAQPYSASLLNISAMSFGSLGEKAIEALNLGAARGGFYHDTGEGSVSRYHTIHGGDLVWEIGSGYFGCLQRDGTFDPGAFKEQAALDQIKMIEIKLSQGAKPGHGGMLPGSKVTPEIAEARDIEAGKDCISPSYHTAFSTPREMIEFAAKLRDMAGGKPVGVKLCVGQPHELFAMMKAMLATGILLDFVVVDGAEGGTGAAPQEFSDHLGLPLREGLILTRNALVGAGLKGNIRLAASGKVKSAFSIAANCAMGADWCNAARSFMFALGCVQSMRCHTGRCPTGVATQDQSRQRGLVIADKAPRVHQFHAATMAALAELVAAAGVTSPDELRPHLLHHRISAIETRSIDRIYPFLARNELIEAPDETPYEGWWQVADPDSFAPRHDVETDRRRGFAQAEQRGDVL